MFSFLTRFISILPIKNTFKKKIWEKNCCQFFKHTKNKSRQSFASLEIFENQNCCLVLETFSSILCKLTMLHLQNKKLRWLQYTLRYLLSQNGGSAQHRGSIRASHPAAPGSNLDAPKIYQMDFRAQRSETCRLEQWTAQSNPKKYPFVHFVQTCSHLVIKVVLLFPQERRQKFYLLGLSNAIPSI